MSEPTDDISVKEYNKISKYEELNIENEKMWNLKTTTITFLVEALDITKKETDNIIT